MKTTSILRQLAPIGMLGVMLFLLTGCPYKSPVPITGPTNKPPAGIEGTWKKASEIDSENGGKLEITASDQKNVLKIKEYSTADLDPTEYQAHFSKVEDDLFINVQGNSLYSEGEGYYLYKVEFKMNNLQCILYEVTPNITETFDNSADLEAFIKKYKDLSFFYTKSGEEGLGGKTTYFHVE